MGYIKVQTPKMYDIKDAITDLIVPATITDRLVYSAVSNKLVYNTVLSKLKAGFNEPWKEIGAALQPAYLNGWSAADDDIFCKPAFMKDLTGKVSLRGRVSGTAATAGTLFILPAGYRPIKMMRFPILRTDYIARYITIDIDGSVYLDAFDGANPTYFFQFDGLTFFPA